jgi:hypothetical protein
MLQNCSLTDFVARAQHDSVFNSVSQIFRGSLLGRYFMFAVLAEGRLAQANFVTISDTKIVFPVEGGGPLNEICVFMTGTMPLPDNYGGTATLDSIKSNSIGVIWFGTPPFTNWKYLGYLTNSKPSAFFKVSHV